MEGQLCETYSPLQTIKAKEMLCSTIELVDSLNYSEV